MQEKLLRDAGVRETGGMNPSPASLSLIHIYDLLIQRELRARNAVGKAAHGGAHAVGVQLIVGGGVLAQHDVHAVSYTHLTHVIRVGAAIGRPPTLPRQFFPGKLCTWQAGTGEQCSPLHNRIIRCV